VLVGFFGLLQLLLKLSDQFVSIVAKIAHAMRLLAE
jgi:hypothetical protein